MSTRTALHRLLAPIVALALLAAGMMTTHVASAEVTVPVLVKDIRPGADGSDPWRFVRLGHQLVFIATTDDSRGPDLWITDGTTEGTELLKVIDPTGYGDPFNLTSAGGRVYFTAYTPAEGYELWVSDGTTAGTQLLKDLVPGTENSFPSNFTEFGDHVYFIAEVEDRSGAFSLTYRLWRTDGTTAGTELVTTTAFENLNRLVVFDDRLFFAADDGQGAGFELWVSDGTAAGTTLFKDIDTRTTGGQGSSFPSEFAAIGDLLYFTAGGPDGGEPWVSDGTVGGTRLLKDVEPGPGASNPGQYTLFRGLVYFVARGELWRTDGTTEGTELFDEINPGVAGADIREFTIVGDLMFFSAYTSAKGYELWVTDGTAAGTRMVKDINPSGFNDSSPQYLTAVGSLLYFSADDGVNGRELWVSDGTEAGTTRVVDADGQPSISIPGAFQNIGDPRVTRIVLLDDTLLLVADDGQLGHELWGLGVSAASGGNGDGGNGNDGTGNDGTSGTTASPVLTGGTLPNVPPGTGVLQLADGTQVALSLSSPAPGQVRYEADGVTVTLTGSSGTSATNGLVAAQNGEILCEVCTSLPAGDVIEVWLFSTPRLVAAHRIGDLDCQLFAIPLGAPLDGAGPVPAGAHTLQLALPTAAGMQAVNVGVTVGGPVPASVPAGEGTTPVTAWLLALSLGALLLARRAGRTRTQH